MPRRVLLDTVRTWFRYAFYDWTQGMARSKRFFTLLAILIQGFAVAVAVSSPRLWIYMMRQHKLFLYLGLFMLYLIADRVMHGLVTSEIMRKTQLEADQIAAQQIQKTLHPEKLDPPAGYEMEVFYEPFRAVGGDYFDVIEVADDRTLFAVADVSGKGMPAALLAANIQALVRSFASIDPDPMVLAVQINKHLNRYTPDNRFATAIFVMLNRTSGELTYVNAGHNPPMVFCDGSATFLEATGMPMGLLPGTQYEARASMLPFGSTLLLYTDGLTDSIGGNDAEGSLRSSISDSAAETVSNLKSLVNPSVKEDDVTILVVKRKRASQSVSGAQ